MTDDNRSKFSKDTILEATLYVLLEDGIKGIKFQSVSERAGVYPSSIAYHFKTIDKLIESAFHFYFASYNREMATYRDTVVQLIESYSNVDLTNIESRDRVLQQYSQMLSELATPSASQHIYLLELDRLFRNELTNFPSISKKIAVQDQADIKLIESFFCVFNCENVEHDAIHLMALLSYLNSQFLQMGPEFTKQEESQELILTLLRKSVPSIS